ncbi:hypothetical protein Tco_1454875 [Tanacetum coccineum]
MLPPNGFPEAEKNFINVIFPKKGGIPPPKDFEMTKFMGNGSLKAVVPEKKVTEEAEVSYMRRQRAF